MSSVTIFIYVLIINLLIKIYSFGILVCDNQIKPPTLNSSRFTDKFGHPIPGPTLFIFMQFSRKFGGIIGPRPPPPFGVEVFLGFFLQKTLYCDTMVQSIQDCLIIV